MIDADEVFRISEAMMVPLMPWLREHTQRTGVNLYRDLRHALEMEYRWKFCRHLDNLVEQE